MSKKPSSPTPYDPHGLNAKQRAFVEHCLKGMPAGRAYETAGYKAKGASADVEASKTLRNPKVSAALAEARGEMRKAAKIEREDALGILVQILLAKPMDVSMENPLCDLKHTAMGPMPAMMEKKDAVDRLTKLLGWAAPEKVEHDIASPVVEMLKRLRSRDSGGDP